MGSIAKGVLGIAKGTSRIVESRRAATQLKRAARDVRVEAAVQGQEIQRVAEEETGRERDRLRAVLASQRARFGAAGVELAGTPVFVALETTLRSIESQESILEGAQFRRQQLTRRGFFQSKALREQARGTALTGLIGGVSDIFGGVSDLPTPPKQRRR